MWHLKDGFIASAPVAFVALDLFGVSLKIVWRLALVLVAWRLSTALMRTRDRFISNLLGHVGKVAFKVSRYCTEQSQILSYFDERRRAVAQVADQLMDELSAQELRVRAEAAEAKSATLKSLLQEVWETKAELEERSVLADVQAAVLKEKARVAQLKEDEVLISASLLLSPSTFDSFIQDIRTETDLISKAAARDGKPLDALPMANAPQAEIEQSLADAPFYALAAVETALQAAGFHRVPQGSTGLQPLSAREVVPAAAAEDGTRAMPTTEAEKVVEAEVLEVMNHLPPPQQLSHSTNVQGMGIQAAEAVNEAVNEAEAPQGTGIDAAQVLNEPVKETEAVEMPIKVEAAAAEEAEVAEEVQNRIGRSVGQRAPAAAVPVEHAVGVPTAAKENSDPFELLLDLIAGGIVVAEALKGESIGEPVDNSRSKSRWG
jgi:quinol monooxygenase YgiN